MNRMMAPGMKSVKVIPKMLSTQANAGKVILTEAQRDFYKKNGYFVINELINSEILANCRKHFVDICDGKADKGNMTVMKEIALISTGATGENLINKVQDIVYDEVFMTYTENPSLLDILSQFLGPNIMAVHSMLINKPPGTSEHPPHQDLHYFPFRPVDKIIATWTAMEEVRKDNGCLYVVPGSHNLDKLFHHDYPKNAAGEINKAYHGILDSDDVTNESQRVYLQMTPGDTVFFHPLLIHGSRPNVSKNFRKAISCHYASSECHYIPTHGTSQENIAKEIENMAKKKYGVDLKFEEVWQYRSKLVRGVKSNL